MNDVSKKTITIQSAFRQYHAEFIGDFTLPLKEAVTAGGVAVIDAVVYKLYKKRMDAILQGSKPILIKANEKTKTIDGCKELIEQLVARGFRRNQKLIAIGGGVVQDIVGFTASILYRGVEWIFFPTTLLAQADSCLGSKTSINLADKKNLVGTFYPPSVIYLDAAFLESLSIEEIKSGIGEMFHFYIYANSPYFEKLIGQYEKVIKNRALLADYIQESLSIKKSVAQTDEFDKGERNKFNYGHTFGHALESVTNYKINHGQAVTVGMDIANFISSKMGLMNETVFKKLHKQLKMNFPSYSLKNIPLDRYLTALSKDKKNVGATIGCILAHAPGKLEKRQVAADAQFQGWLRTYFTSVYVS